MGVIDFALPARMCRARAYCGRGITFGVIARAEVSSWGLWLCKPCKKVLVRPLFGPTERDVRRLVGEICCQGRHTNAHDLFIVVSGFPTFGTRRKVRLQPDLFFAGQAARGCQRTKLSEFLVGNHLLLPFKSAALDLGITSQATSSNRGTHWRLSRSSPR